MRIVLVTGEYPPDVGGTATRAAQLMQLLPEHQHEVMLLTLGERRADSGARAALRVSRRWPWPLRLAGVTWWLVRHRRRYDVVYALSLHAAAAAGSRVARRPLVLYIPGDHTWERARRLGLTHLDFETFQSSAGGPPRLRAMRALQRWTLRQAAALSVPSEFMHSVVARWLDRPADIAVLPTALPAVPPAPHAEPREGGLRAVFVGRLVPVKRVDVLIQAVAASGGVSLDIVGDGPDLGRLRSLAADLGDTVRFHGPLPHGEAVARIAAADVLVLASEAENFPNVVAEALGSGTPVVAPRVGGIAEAVMDGRTGLLLDQATMPGVAAVLQRLRDDHSLLSTMQEHTWAQTDRWRNTSAAEQVADLLKSVLTSERLG